MPSQVRMSLFFAASLLMLHVVGYFFSTALTWGFHTLAFLPPAYLISYVVLGGAWLYVACRSKTDLSRTVNRWFPGKLPYRLLIIAVGGLVTMALVFHVEASLLGDSFFLVKNFAESMRGESPLFLRNEPLSTYYFAIIMKSLAVRTYESFLVGFLRAELLLGLGYCVNIFIISMLLFSDKPRQALAVFFVMAIPTAQLFFGYIEVYSAVLFFVSLYVVASLLYLSGRISFAWVMITFLAQVGGHYLTLLTAPSLLYLGYREFRQNRWKPMVIGGAACVAIIMTVLGYENFELEKFYASIPHSHFLSLTSAVDDIGRYAEVYTLFSLFHLLDLANYLVLMGVAILFVAAVAGKSAWRLAWMNPMGKFLLLGTVLPLCFLLIVRLDLGMARDWDVLAFLFLLIALSAVTIVFSNREAWTFRVVLLVAGVSLLNSLTYYAVNGRKDSAEQRFFSLLDRRLLSQNAYYGASLHYSLYAHQTGDRTTPSALWARYIDLFPHDERGYRNVITNLRKSLAPDAEERILAVYERWADAGAGSELARRVMEDEAYDAGMKCFERNELREAERYFRVAVRVNPSSARSRNNLGSVLAEAGRLEEARAEFHQAVTLDGSYADACFNLGRIYLDLGDRREAKIWLTRALELGNENAATVLQSSFDLTAR